MLARSTNLYVLNPNVTPPPDPSVPIWRHMDLSQLIAVLDSRALWFSQVARLASAASAHGDPFEGSHPATEVAERKEAYFADLPPDHQERALADFSDMNRRMRKVVYVNCWHMNEHESAAMWRTYLSAGEGIAIRSTFRRVACSVEADPRGVFIGQVNYIDYAQDHLPNESQYAPFFTKRKSFEHEHELRAMVYHPPGDNRAWENIPDDEFTPGLLIQVDLDQLVEAVYVSPASPRWFRDVVESVLARYGFGKEVKQSALAEPPLH